MIDTMALMPTSLLRISDLDAIQLDWLLDASAEKKERPMHERKAMRGESVACYFSKPSTRTRVSFEAAAWRLGALPIMLRPDELQLGRGEPIADTARVLSGYCAAIVVRTFAHDEVVELARHASVPVINALTDAHHPCQALADLLTLRERFGDLRGLRLAYVGDGNNVAHSLIEACALSGMHLRLATPEGREPDPEVVRFGRATAVTTGGSVDVLHDPVEAVQGAHAVYTDVWVSMGDEEHERDRVEELSAFSVTADLMGHARRDAVFMHCLPAHRGQEVTAEVIDGRQSVVFQQAANRLPTEQAVLWALTIARRGS